MATYIISDLHLCESKPFLTKAFEQFYRRLLLNDKLIIAGDLFDFWVGLDYTSPLQRQVRDIVIRANRKGIHTFIQCGNRDFLLNRKAAAYFGMKLLPPLHLLPTPKGTALLMHGDLLCQNDKAFKVFRAISNNNTVRFLFMHLPRFLRQGIGQFIRNRSQSQNELRSHNSKRYGMVMKVAANHLKATKSRILIHGHFHKVEEEWGEFGEHTGRLALGMWGTNYSYVHIDTRSIEVVQRPLDRLF